MKFPEISKEWHPTLNGNLKPENFSYGSDEIVWWVCDKRHEYQAHISNRTSQNSGCPYCAKKQVLKGFNDLETWCIENNRSDLLNEWDYDKNQILPSEIMAHSGKEFWWVCKHGHSFQSKITKRTLGNCGCPFCNNRILLKGFNDFETYCKNNNLSYLLDEWSYEKNDILPSEILRNARTKIWWKCKICGGSWQSSLQNRIKGSGCLICAGHRKVRCVETNEVFESGTLAAKKYNIKKPHNIADCCKGKSKTAGGYHWEYVDDNEET